MEFTAIARRLGLFSAAATVVLLAAYAVTLTIGLLSLESPDQPIRNPMFAILEILIIVMMPAIVALMIAVHAWAPTRLKALSFAAVVFMGLLAGLTSSVHFVILTLSREPEFARQSWLPLVLEFKWPSIAYALEILGWDVFFALSMLFAAPVFGWCRMRGMPLSFGAAVVMRGLAGLSGVAFGDMQLRNIGIVGYVPVFLVAAALLGVLIYRTAPCDRATDERATGHRGGH